MIEQPFNQIRNLQDEKLRPGRIQIGEAALLNAIEYIRIEKEIANMVGNAEVEASWRREEKLIAAAMDGHGLRPVTY